MKRLLLPALLLLLVPAGAVGAPTDGATDAPFTVWTKHDAVADGKQQYTEQVAALVAAHPAIVTKRVIGTSVFGREIIALRVTRDPAANRPAVLYVAMQHGDEWLAGETCRRTLDYVVENDGLATSAGQRVTQLIDTTELWFVCVANPDGNEYTFTPGNRRWHKNLRDTPPLGAIEKDDGVDLDRNFPARFALDDEGSSGSPEALDFRGPSAGSEPETDAFTDFADDIDPMFIKSDHAGGGTLLYPQTFQADTASADEPLFACAGRRQVLAGDRRPRARAGRGRRHRQRGPGDVGVRVGGRAAVRRRRHRAGGVPGLRGADRPGVPRPPRLRAGAGRARF